MLLVLGLTELKAGTVVSIIRFLFDPSEFKAPTVGRVNTNALPAASVIVPELRTKADVDA